MTPDAHGRRAEILRLARLLRVEPEQLDYLQSVDDADLRVFRDQVTDALFNAHAATMKRLASAAKLLPAPVLAKIAEKVFGPLLCARIASQIDPGRATDVAKRLPIAFITDLAIELDPRRSQPIISNIPTKTIVAVAMELADREDWLTLGRFVGFLEDAQLKECLGAIGDSQVLHTAFAVDDPSAIAAVLDLLAASRLSALIKAASAERLWPMLLGIAAQLRDDQIVDLAGTLADQDKATLDELVDAAAEEELWHQLLPLAAALPARAQDVLAESARRLTPEARAYIIREAETLGLYDELGTIADALDDEAVA